MSASPDHERIVQALRPTGVTWSIIESALERCWDNFGIGDSPASGPANFDGLGDVLTALVSDVVDLRLPDALFCPHEAPEEELARRRLLLWDQYLKPMTRYVCTSRRLSKSERASYAYCWAKSQGPPLSTHQGPHNARIAAVIKSARAGYRDDMARVLAEASAEFEEEARPLYEKLLADEHGAVLCAIPKKKMKVEAEDMTNNRFLVTPTWAQRKDLVGAIKQLCVVGAIRSEGELSDLFQQGRHRLFGGESQKAVFVNSDSLQFWMGLVSMWLIGIHETHAVAFDVSANIYSVKHSINYLLKTK